MKTQLQIDVLSILKNEAPTEKKIAQLAALFQPMENFKEVEEMGPYLTGQERFLIIKALVLGLAAKLRTKAL